MLLRDVADITVGYPFRGKIPEQSGTGIVAVQMKDIGSEYYVNWGNCIETELTGKKKPVWLKLGDILVAARGNSNYAALVAGVVDQLRSVASPHFFVLSNYSDKISPQYLQWFINQTPSQRYFQREAEGTLTKSIRRSVLENLPVAVPSIEKQEKIVQLHMALVHEQIVLRQLTHNAQRMMNTIVNDLIKEANQDNKAGNIFK
ncbi:hypothetical protein MNBD_GAMMA07-845 [hydrothermal vent metagenome]|uniref:Type I restriction modification DNA specificity domain-containing protein n=1 Tax=hydrothermal vent metagenome TaxID=652676 RepID=A0A3B0WWY4_9ZZZZ